MKKIINIALFFITTIAFSQTKTIENVSYFGFRNFGTITKDSLTTHYSFHTTTNPSENKKIEGVLTFYNKDLSEAKKEIFMLNNKSDIYLETQNNGSQIITAFHNNEKETSTFKIFSESGDLLNTNEISAEIKNFDLSYHNDFGISRLHLIIPCKKQRFFGLPKCT